MRAMRSPSPDPGGRRGRVVAVGALIAAMGVGVAVHAAARADGPATVAATAVRAEPEHPFLLVSDSAWLSIRIYGSIDAIQGAPHLLDLASCRRRVVASCRNYDGSVPITLADEIRLRPGPFHTLVVATGYNDGDQALASEIGTIVELARDAGMERVVWLTLREDVAYTSPDDTGYGAVFVRHNALVRDVVAAGTYPELVVADWAEYARDLPEWFAADGIHLRGAGSWAAADYISRKLAFLDGRACPQPASPGAVAPDPCPDPDAGPPEIDVDGLYPVGQPNPTARFQLEWEGDSSWPDPPWWEL